METTTQQLATLSLKPSSKYFRKDIGDLTINNFNQIKTVLEPLYPFMAVNFDDAFYKREAVENSDFCQLGK
jgi:hypothetical protein